MDWLLDSLTLSVHDPALEIIELVQHILLFPGYTWQTPSDQVLGRDSGGNARRV